MIESGTSRRQQNADKKEKDIYRNRHGENGWKWHEPRCRQLNSDRNMSLKRIIFIQIVCYFISCVCFFLFLFLSFCSCECFSFFLFHRHWCCWFFSPSSKTSSFDISNCSLFRSFSLLCSVLLIFFPDCDMISNIFFYLSFI